MIRLPTLFFLFSLLILIACGDDDDQADVFSNDSLVGTWDVTSFETDLKSTVSGVPADTFVTRIENSQLSVTFAADGTWSSTGSYDFVTVDSDSTTIDREDGLGAGTYSVDGQVVTMTDSNPDTVGAILVDMYTVISYTANSRVEMAAEINESFTDPIFNLEITTTGTSTIVLEQ